ncbi:MAG: phosphoribosylamine--glycine ligase [Acidobacteriota bacterium]|nr:phosphoribosylamine--glycine ligase [Acidobacteriota bacterium]MDH3784004.1 phosphoribosylamine--glycine ligase [Acidobacteriota bacterium]
MKVLLIGGGGREAALAWALSQSGRLSQLDCAPGNAGIARHANCLDLSATDVDALVRHAIEVRYDLVVVGPEAPLVDGLVDRLREHDIAAFGPSAAAARMEGSKIFSKRFMQRHGIPTGEFEAVEDFATARAYLEATDRRYPLVVKADGLAAGKGVIIAESPEQAVEAAESMLSGEGFGDAGRRVLIEEFLTGREASFFVLADGHTAVELATCQDYKRAHDGDRGPNTGGMGTYSPSVYLDDALKQTIRRTIVEPTLAGMKQEEFPFKGVLFIGVMLTDRGPQVLEYNVRFGDPETQVLIPRLDGDWLDLLDRCARGSLAEASVRWDPRSAVCVVMAAGGYPGAYGKGFPIEGLDAAGEMHDVHVFHAGTAFDETQQVVTSGGRVLGVTALGENLNDARERAYSATRKIQWQDEQHRGDIAADAIERRDG